MPKKYVFSTLLTFFISVLYAQTENTITYIDWRQHNVIKYNKNLFNPTFSFVKQEGADLSFWGRVQWVGIENSPKTYFLNYSGKITEKSGGGIALFQTNLGLYVDSGVLINYARGIQLSRESWLTFGLNTSLVKRGIDNNALVTPTPEPILQDNKDDFLLVFAPAVTLTLGYFDVGIVADNLFDYNLTTSSSVTDFSKKAYTGHLSYTYPFRKSTTLLSEGNIKGLVYAKSVPNADIQYGINTLLDLPEHGWLQIGYNNIYGISGGLGAKIGSSFGVGFVVETGTSSNRAFGATYEAVATIEFGKAYQRNKQISFDEGPVWKEQPEVARTKTLQKENKNTNEVEVTATKEVNKKEEAQTLNKVNKEVETLQPIDNIKDNPTVSANTTPIENKIVEEEIAEDKKHDVKAEQPSVQQNIEKAIDYTQIQSMDIEQLDSLNINKDTNKEVLQNVFNANEYNRRYQAVERIEGVEYGFYLVVNVFSQKKYFELFLKFLTQKKLVPKYFYSEENKYYYVYLQKYDKLSEIEHARRTKYNGKYFGETWILWVRRN